MAWEEWERLKAVAVEEHSARMQLNQLPSDQSGTIPSGGAASGTLRSDRKAWSAAGEAVGGLRETIGRALTGLAYGQAGLSKDSGCLTEAAQKTVHDSWERRVKEISELCDGLAGVLEKVGHDQLRTDEAIQAEIAGLKVCSGSTAAVGSTNKGR